MPKLTFWEFPSPQGTRPPLGCCNDQKPLPRGECYLMRLNMLDHRPLFMHFHKLVHSIPSFFFHFLNLLLINNSEKSPPPYPHLVVVHPGREGGRNHLLNSCACLTRWVPKLGYTEERGASSDLRSRFMVCVERSCYKKVHLGMKRKQQHGSLEDVSA